MQTGFFEGIDYTTKLELQKKLAISPSTMAKYHNLILFNICDFKNEYPTVDYINHTEVCTRTPLTSYQVWCLEAVINYCKGKSFRLVVAAFKNREKVNELFGKEAYQKQKQKDQDSIIDVSAIALYN